jgi:hypothetical protein
MVTQQWARYGLLMIETEEQNKNFSASFTCRTKVAEPNGVQAKRVFENSQRVDTREQPPARPFQHFPLCGGRTIIDDAHPLSASGLLRIEQKNRTKLVNAVLCTTYLPSKVVDPKGILKQPLVTSLLSWWSNHN